MSQDYCSLKQWVPSDFGRKPRSFAELTGFKASEYRMLMLYSSPILFNENIPKDQMLHFNLLNCALRILNDPIQYSRNNDLTHELLFQYVVYFRNFYGEHHIIYNVHNLLHLAKQALRLGPIYSYSVTDFEGYLQKIKKMVNKSSRVAPQVMNRLTEMNKSKVEKKFKLTKEVFASSSHVILSYSCPQVPSALILKYNSKTFS